MKRKILFFIAAWILTVGIAGSTFGQWNEKKNQLEVSKVKALKVETGNTIVLRGVEFAPGTVIITTNSDSILIRALKTLLENPKMEVEIRSYTENSGDTRNNLRLSQNRADAVKIWFVKRGISTARINAKGFGSEYPIATNSTPEGRAQNRRIEFIRIK